MIKWCPPRGVYDWDNLLDSSPVAVSFKWRKLRRGMRNNLPLGMIYSELKLLGDAGLFNVC